MSQDQYKDTYCYVTIEYADLNLKKEYIENSFKLIKLGEYKIIFELENGLENGINYRNILSININSIHRAGNKRYFILLNNKSQESDEFDLEYLYELIMVNDKKSIALITKTEIYNDKLGFNKQKSYLINNIKEFIVYEEDEICKLINMNKKKYNKIDLSKEQYCYVYLKHKDDFINKTIVTPNYGYLKLIGVDDNDLIFSNFNEDGAFELEIFNIVDVSINTIVNHNKNPDYILIEESGKITDNIYEVLFCDEKKSTAVICKTKIVGNIFCFVGDRVSIIRNINDFKRYKQEDILNIMSKDTGSNKFEHIDVLSFDKYKKEKSLSLKTKFEEIISDIIKHFNDDMYRNSQTSIYSNTLFFEYELKPNDKEVFLINDGFVVIRNILNKKGWVVDDISFHNDGLFLVIQFKI
ncbi:MAG: hypothetical protein KC589_08335 [Nanoarchaeota archaeon]|nr:hypothetical protein [Nanoarchaeota archaeon]